MPYKQFSCLTTIKYFIFDYEIFYHNYIVSFGVWGALAKAAAGAVFRAHARHHGMAISHLSGIMSVPGAVFAPEHYGRSYGHRK